MAAQLVRDAIEDARRNGINEWHNREYCSNCAGEPVTAPTQPGGLQGQCVPNGIGCQSYPMRGDWYGGAMIYGPNIGSVWRAAQRILPALPPPPPPLPPPTPAPPPITPPPTGCNVSAPWRFWSLVQPGAFETNDFVEASDGALRLTPGKNDGWKAATGRVYGDWSVEIVYYASNPKHHGPTVMCELARNCSFIRCPAYTYTRLPGDAGAANDFKSSDSAESE